MGKGRRGVSRELRFAFCSQLHRFPYPHQPHRYGREAVLSACVPDPSLLSGCCPQSSFHVPASPTVPTPSHQHLTHSALSFKKSFLTPTFLSSYAPSLLPFSAQLIKLSLFHSLPLTPQPTPICLSAPSWLQLSQGPPRPARCCTTPRCFCSPPLTPALSCHITARGLFQHGTPGATPSSKIFLV